MSAIHFTKEVLSERPVRILLVSLLASLAFLINLSKFSKASGKDFYQYWVVSKAQRYSGHRLGNPYVAMAQYDDILKSVARSSTELRQQKANGARPHLELFQTPFCFL